MFCSRGTPPVSQVGSKPVRTASPSQPGSQPAGQAAGQPCTRERPCRAPDRKPVSQEASQPVRRPAGYPASRSSSQPVSQSVSQPVSQSASHPVSQSSSQPISRAGRQAGGSVHAPQEPCATHPLWVRTLDGPASGDDLSDKSYPEAGLSRVRTHTLPLCHRYLYSRHKPSRVNPLRASTRGGCTIFWRGIWAIFYGSSKAATRGGSQGAFGMTGLIVIGRPEAGPSQTPSRYRGTSPIGKRPPPYDPPMILGVGPR